MGHLGKLVSGPEQKMVSVQAPVSITGTRAFHHDLFTLFSLHEPRGFYDRHPGGCPSGQVSLEGGTPLSKRGDAPIVSEDKGECPGG